MALCEGVTLGWLIGTYLYLGGMAGGMWMFGFAADYKKGEDKGYYAAAKAAMYTAPWLLVVGMILLVLDLKRAGIAPSGLLHLMNVFNNPGSSMITIGTVIILAATVWGLVTAILYFGNATRRWRLVFSFIAAILGFATATYTGLLLALARHMVLWNTGWLPWLFVTSGVSSGIALALIMTRVLGSLTPSYILPEFKEIRERWLEIAERIHHYDIMVMWMELVALLGLIADVAIRYGSKPVSWLVASSGAPAGMFWLYFIGGWLIPVAMYYTMPKRNRVAIYLGAVLIAALALALRCAILGAPQMAFKNAGFPYH